MIIVVSHNEYKNKRLKEALGNLAFPDNLPFDFMILTERGPIPAERKKFPQDFLASVEDGRFSSECAAMRDVSEFRFIICEGKPRYSRKGRLMAGRRESRYSKAGFRNLCRSLEFVEGCKLEWSSDQWDTVQVLKELQDYFDKEKHLSLRTRPKFLNQWFESATYEQRFLFWLQGCGPGIGPATAIELAKVFHSPAELFSAEVTDIMKVKGVGKITATSIYSFLRGGR